MDNPKNDIQVDFEERSTLSRAYSSITKAIGEMAIITVAVPAVWRIFSKEVSIAETIKHSWAGSGSWLTYLLVGITSALNYHRESQQDKAVLTAHIENTVREKQLHDAGLKAAVVTSIQPYGSHEQTPATAQPSIAPEEPLRSELAHTQQALNDVSHELEVVTNHAASLKAPTESHAEQAAIAKAAAEQATATIH